jgi:photosystem II stability/assembly factor-like uncharacterized protein
MLKRTLGWWLVGFVICFGLINFAPGLHTVQAKNDIAADSLGDWKIVPSPAAYDLHSVAMASSSDGWIVGSQGYFVSGDSIGPALLRWNGSQWKEISLSPSKANLIFDTVAIAGPHDVWVGGGYGESAFYDTQGVIYHWNGSTWGSVYPSSRILSIKGSSNGALWASGLFVHNLSSGGPVSCASTEVLFSFDGNNWNGTVNAQTGNSASPGYHGMSIDPDNNIWVTLGAVVAKYDGNGNNRQVFHPINPTYRYFMAIDMVSANDGWVAGKNGMMQHWDGNTWTAVTSPTVQTIRSIKMLSTQDGWAVGDAGTILHWDGISWSSVTSPVADDLKSISMISPNEGWIAGNNGAILQYTNFRNLYLPLVTH